MRNFTTLSQEAEAHSRTVHGIPGAIVSDCDTCCDYASRMIALADTTPEELLARGGVSDTARRVVNAVIAYRARNAQKEHDDVWQ